MPNITLQCIIFVQLAMQNSKPSERSEINRPVPSSTSLLVIHCFIYCYPSRVNSDWQIDKRLTAKVERAEHHIEELQSSWKSFKAKAYTVTPEDDLNTGERIWKLTDFSDIPNNIPLIIGDAVHNLRSALDHIIFHLASVCTDPVAFKGLYFPIAANAVDFEKRLGEASVYKPKSPGVVKRLRPDAIEALRALEPYEGGRGAILYGLNRLDVIDKHHLLLTVSSRNPTHSMPPKVIASYIKGLGIAGEFTAAQESAFFKTDSVAPFPLKKGDTLARVPLGEANENMDFTFTVAFGEPEILKGKPVIETLHHMAYLIRDIIRTFSDSGLFQ